MKIYSYVVEHDCGYGPFADAKYCTLVNCKYDKSGKCDNIVERADLDDWIIGTGGAGPKSTGPGTLVFAMQVTEKLPLVKYKKRFRTRKDANETNRENKRFALISDRFVYYGVKAKHKRRWLKRAWIKKGPKYRVIDDPKDVAELLKLLKPRLRGKRGDPTCPPHSKVMSSGQGCR